MTAPKTNTGEKKEKERGKGCRTLMKASKTSIGSGRFGRRRCHSAVSLASGSSEKSHEAYLPMG